MSASEMEKSGSFFKDGVRQIDFVFVLADDIKSIDIVGYVIEFFHFLQVRGIHLELFRRSPDSSIFIKMHIPDKALMHFAHLYGIDITYPGHFVLPEKEKRFRLKYCQTILTTDRNDYFIRKGSEATSMERILIAYEILQEVVFDDHPAMYGVQKLTKLGGFRAAYPLHDGDYDSEEYNDRQALYKYWASFPNFLKEQPLNLVQKYYGSEVAFYFAWVGFYNKMLIPAAIVGFLCFLSGLFQLIRNQPIIEETCNSDKPLCPICPTEHMCIQRSLKGSCAYTIVSSIFDNRATVFFAVFMSFWATVFINLWRRWENVLRIRWNIEIEESDTKLRLGFLEKATETEYSPITHQWEPHIPRGRTALHYCFTYATFIFLIAIVILAVLVIVIYRICLNGLVKMSGNKGLIDHMTFLSMTTGALLQVIFIKLFGCIYAPMSEWLTKIENPRTQTEFDNSVVHKRYVLAFVNNYTPLFYMAFVKGRFYTPNHTRLILSFETDTCHTCGCLMALCIQLGFLMVLKSFVGNMLTLITPFITGFCKKKPTENLTPWEKELGLKPAKRYLLTAEFTEMIIQYGCVTFFVAAFPLGPLCAFLNNLLEFRLDAYKLVTRYRRVLPKRGTGMQPWNGILRTITFLSIATNAFVLAFTSDFVPREIWESETGSLKNFVNSTLSIFDMSDFDVVHKVSENQSDWCYYRAHRYPPNHEDKYHLTTNFYIEIIMRLICVLVFEHVLVALNGLLSNFLSDMPTVVKETLYWKHTQERDLRLKNKRLT